MLRRDRKQPVCVPVGIELEIGSGCVQNVNWGENEDVQECGKDVFWALEDREYCYKCGLERMLSVLKHENRILDVRTIP